MLAPLVIQHHLLLDMLVIGQVKGVTRVNSRSAADCGAALVPAVSVLQPPLLSFLSPPFPHTLHMLKKISLCHFP
jgi:hypothetical protein